MKSSAYAPSRVYQGVPNYFRHHFESPSGNISIQITSFDKNIISPEFVNDPPSIWWKPYNGHVWEASADTNLDIQVFAPSGNAVFTINYSNPEGNWNFDFNLPIYSNPLPNAPLPPPPDPVLPSINFVQSWHDNFFKNYAGFSLSDPTEDGIWYYDFGKVAYEMPYDVNLRAYARQSVFNYAFWQNYGMKGTAGYEVFSNGLKYVYLDCVKNNDASGANTCLSTLKNMYINAQWGSGSFLGYFLDPAQTRPTAYALEMQNVFTELNLPAPRLYKLASMSLYHLDMWCISQCYTNNVVPYQIGLAAESLINYHNLTGDKRIPEYIKATADWLIDKAYVPEECSFVYVYNAPPASSVRNYDWVLNLLTVPILGYAYKLTGDNKYKDIGDKVFATGVAQTWLGAAKAFTQNYRWSRKYLEWTGQLPSGY
jgi:hypothetical protein